MLPGAIWLQYLLPKQWLTVAMGRLARLRGGAFTRALIRRFVARYGVDMQEAAESRIAHYASFNDFFTRALREGVRPIASAPFICPVDGTVSQQGPIVRDQLLQAKGHMYSTGALLGGDAALAARFDGGDFVTLYLAPRDYHRIHMPCAGQLVQMLHVPGSLFSVNPLTAQHVPGLFARNERVVCEFETAYGPMAVVLVGATIVGSMATVWHGVVARERRDTVRQWRYAPGEVMLAKGAELGRFLVGSTVVLLFPPGVVRVNSGWASGRSVRMGESMGELARPTAQP